MREFVAKKLTKCTWEKLVNYATCKVSMEARRRYSSTTTVDESSDLNFVYLSDDLTSSSSASEDTTTESVDVKRVIEEKVEAWAGRELRASSSSGRLEKDKIRSAVETWASPAGVKAAEREAEEQRRRRRERLKEAVDTWAGVGGGEDQPAAQQQPPPPQPAPQQQAGLDEVALLDACRKRGGATHADDVERMLRVTEWNGQRRDDGVLRWVGRGAVAPCEHAVKDACEGLTFNADRHAWRVVVMEQPQRCYHVTHVRLERGAPGHRPEHYSFEWSVTFELKEENDTQQMQLQRVRMRLGNVNAVGPDREIVTQVLRRAFPHEM